MKEGVKEREKNDDPEGREYVVSASPFPHTLAHSTSLLL